MIIIKFNILIKFVLLYLLLLYLYLNLLLLKKIISETILNLKKKIPFIRFL